MAQPITARLRIVGRFGTDGFADWICHRARLLDLTGQVRILGPAEIEVLAHGPMVLVDAMEVACLLGPSDARVDTIEHCRINTLPIPIGFSRA